MPPIFIFTILQSVRKEHARLVTRAPSPAITWLLYNKKLNESNGYAKNNLSSTCAKTKSSNYLTGEIQGKQTILDSEVFKCEESVQSLERFSIWRKTLPHSRSFLANQKVRNAIVGAENLLMNNKPYPLMSVPTTRDCRKKLIELKGCLKVKTTVILSPMMNQLEKKLLRKMKSMITPDACLTIRGRDALQHAWV